jgi:hypothetical protein
VGLVVVRVAAGLVVKVKGVDMWVAGSGVVG